jgi:hypothetical protein
MSEITVVTNNHPRDLLSSHELDDKIRAKYFDYIEDGEWFEECYNRFFQYKGWWYDINEFQQIPALMLKHMKWWDGYSPDTFFSGILVKYAGFDRGFDRDLIIVGRYYA